MLSNSIKNDEMLVGCIYGYDGKYCELYIKNSIKNVAAFVSRAQYVAKVDVVDMADRFVLSTNGGFLASIFDMDYRADLLEELIPMQTCETETPEIEIANIDFEEFYGMNQKDYLNWITETTGYEFVD